MHRSLAACALVLGGAALADPPKALQDPAAVLTELLARTDAVAKEVGLRQILAWMEKKFAATPVNRVHLLKSLVYFADAEREPMPDMLAPIPWPVVTSFFETQVPGLL